MERRIIRVGSRESKLAVVQSQMVMDTIKKHHPELELELVTMKTTGDIILDKTLDKIGGKGLFVKELDKALLDGKIDISVHSLKDMPMEVPPELPLLAYMKRESPADALVLPEGAETIDEKNIIGSSSKRRNYQLRKLYPQMEEKSIRGNVITRLSKLDNGHYSALVLACAGLVRLGLEHRISKVFQPEEMIPAAGQGILVVQGRAGEDHSYLDCVNDGDTQVAAEAERAFVSKLDGGCSSPVGAYTRLDGDRVTIWGFYCEEDGSNYRKGKVTGSKEEAVRLAEQLALDLAGAKEGEEA